MKEYMEQIYDEGLGLTIYKPVEKTINKIKNKGIKKALNLCYQIFYFVLAICIAVGLFFATYPL